MSVTNNYGTGSLPGFTFIPAPTITSFSPMGGVNGTNCYGEWNKLQQYFECNSRRNHIHIQLHTGFFYTNCNTDQRSRCVRKHRITTPGGVASAPGFVFNPQPTLTSISPTEAGTGMTVNIAGTNFTGATSVTFGGITASSFIVNSPTSISAIVGAGGSGNVIVTNA